MRRPFTGSTARPASSRVTAPRKLGSFSAAKVCGNEAAVHWVDGETGFFEGYGSEEAWLVLGGEYDRCVELESLEPYDGLADVYWDDPSVRGL